MLGFKYSKFDDGCEGSLPWSTFVVFVSMRFEMASERITMCGSS